ncbi:hypothetical protein CLU79DRAFT_739384 [Phycomyces nitens]|nr:hypothetical protein CLU79DRAFT_739384 [Phycomyces nitens]
MPLSSSTFTMKDQSLASIPDICTTTIHTSINRHPSTHKTTKQGPRPDNRDNTTGTRPRSGSHHDEDKKTHFLSKLIQKQRHEGLGPSVSVMTIAPNPSSPSLSQRQKKRTGVPASLVVPDRAHSDPNIPVSPHTKKGTRKKKTNRTLDRLFKMLGKSHHDPEPSIDKEDGDGDDYDDNEDDQDTGYPHERRSASFGTTRSDISGGKKRELSIDTLYNLC